MSATMTLGQLRTATRQRSDMVNSQFVTDAEFNSYINQSYFELYDILVSTYGDDYYVAPVFPITTNGTDFQFPLPADFYKLKGVDLNINGAQDSWVTLRPFNFQERNRYAVPNFQSFYGITNLRYRVNGNNLWFTPIPTAGQTINVWYVPRMTELVTDGDVCDGISGWTEYIICDAAIKAMQKEESDVSVLMAQKQALLQRIQSQAENRDQGMPQTVTDTQSSQYWWPNGNGNPGSGY